MAWYQLWFGKEYLELYSHRDDKEAELHAALLLDSIKPVLPRRMLDIACGAGRHLSRFAKRGIETFGIDLSLELLREHSGDQAQLLQADMRALPFKPESFNAITSFFTSFGYFETDLEHLELLKEWRRVLCKAGYLYIDYLNREQVITGLIPESRKKIGDKQVLEQRSITEDGKRVEKRILIKNNKSGEQQEFLESVRMYSRDEMEEMLAESGFKTKLVFGDMSGSSYSERSPRLILLAQREEVV